MNIEERILNIKHCLENNEIKKLSTFSQSEMSRKNLELKNKFQGNRCFVLGNAPSIKNENLEQLKNEVVFVVNEFFKFDEYDKVQPDYYVFLDMYYFNEKYIKELKVIMKDIEKLKEKERKPIFIVPTTARKMVKYFYKWNQWTDVYYIEPKLQFYEGYFEKIDMTKPVPSQNSVTRMAILLATYMGFQDIYLLGVEETGLLDNLGLYENKEYKRYAYDWDSEEEKNAIEQAKGGVVYGKYLKNNIVRYVKEYRRVYEYCRKQNVNLYNCTPVSIIDSIPYISLTECLSKKGN